MAGISTLPRLTLWQMMKLTVFAAAASACLGPIARLVENGVMGWTGATIMAGVAVPLALTITALLIIATGPKKDRIISVFLLISVSVALATAIYFPGLDSELDLSKTSFRFHVASLDVDRSSPRNRMGISDPANRPGT